MAHENTIYHDLQINAIPEIVFKAISHPEQLVQWWPLVCEGVQELDGIYHLYFAPEYDWYGKVTQFIPNSSFHIKMTKSSPDWNPTTFGFDIEKKGSNSLVQFTHKGWSECNTHFRTASFCWALLLKGLKDYVEKGTILPFHERG